MVVLLAAGVGLGRVGAGVITLARVGGGSGVGVPPPGAKKAHAINSSAPGISIRIRL
jgi:hypothetical protein